MGTGIIKKYLSYLTPLPIESCSSELNNELHIQLYQGRYRLTTANAIYSFEDRYDNFRGAFQKVDWNRFQPQNTLVLGLGLGSILQLLEGIFQVKTQFTCIEIDETIVHLAEKYILKKLETQPNIIITDARPFLESTHESYDLILMDVFQDDVIPAYFESGPFLELIRLLLNPEGLFIYNRLGFTKQDKRQSVRFFNDVFHDKFPEGVYYYIHNNYMLFNHSLHLRQN